MRFQGLGTRGSGLLWKKPRGPGRDRLLNKALGLSVQTPPWLANLTLSYIWKITLRKTCDLLGEKKKLNRTFRRQDSQYRIVLYGQDE